MLVGSVFRNKTALRKLKPPGKEIEMKESMTYAGVGVNYDAMDPFKRMAQLAGRETSGNIARLNDGEFKELKASRRRIFLLFSV